MQEIYRVKTSPVALSDNMIIGEKYRITFLTEALVRLEYSEDGVFEDRATQTVLFRDFPKTGYHVVRNADGIEVHTSMLHLIYNEKEFSSHGLSIQIKGNLSAYHSIWHYGEKVHDLQGTARTLDDVNGEVELGHGVVSRFGYSILDDSKSQILLDDGLSQEKKVCLICISLDMDMIINRRSMIFTGFAARLRCFRDMHWETGGADIINTQKKAIWS
jgi:hypothetical protein